MHEIRIHGRGGQGVVTAAELVAVAAFHQGRFSQAFPRFGVERRGAPIESFARIDNKFIRKRSHIYEPDYVIIQDATLIGSTPVFKGLKAGGVAIINTGKSAAIYQKYCPQSRIITVPATEIAIEKLGKPIINTVMLGAFAGVSGLIKEVSLKKAINERFSGELAGKNTEAMLEAYYKVRRTN